jgi:hypothetical protein
MGKASSRNKAEALREFIDNAPEGSPLAEARKFGVDLYSILENLKLTPGERFRRAAEETDFVRRLRRNTRKAAR